MSRRKFRAVFVVSCLALPVLNVVSESISVPFGTTVAVLMFLCWPITVLLLVVWPALLLKSNWRQALVAALLPALLTIAMLTSQSQMLAGVGYLRDIGDVLHFLRSKLVYDYEIALLPDDGHRFEEFEWGGLLLFAGTSLVYDETDQISLPIGHQSATFLAQIRNTELTCGRDKLDAKIQPLFAHYYLAYTGC